MKEIESIKSITLYHFSKTRSARVIWALLEAGITDFNVTDVNLMAGEHLQPYFLKLNPNHAVPVLVLQWSDGSTQHIYESTAIVLWIADTFPANKLAPPLTSPQKRADYLQMAHYGGTSFDGMLWQIRLHTDFLGPNSDLRTIERYRSKIITEVEPTLIKRLEKNPYICGAQFTAADILIGHCVYWAKTYKLCAAQSFTAYLNRFSQRVAYDKSYGEAA